MSGEMNPDDKERLEGAAEIIDEFAVGGLPEDQYEVLTALDGILFSLTERDSIAGEIEQARCALRRAKRIMAEEQYNGEDDE